MAPQPRPAVVPPIVFNDFKPGIIDLPGVQYPTAAATRTNTYRCRAKPSGALIPAPRQDFSLNGTDFEGANPSASGKYFCSGIFAAGPVLPVVGGVSATGRFHDLWIATEYALTAPSKRRRLQLVREFEAAPTTDLIYTADQTSALDATSAYGCTFGGSRANSAIPNEPGIPVIAIAWPSSIVANSIMYEWPDDTVPTTNAPFVIGTDLTLVITHQNRFVFRKQTGYAHGLNGSWSTTEDLEWTDTNNPHSALSPLQAFYPELADGYSMMASMSANELFCLKESGAIVLVGDLNDPTVTNLPMVAGSGGAPMSAGVRTPQGLFYSTRNGIWSWAHGDASQHVSPMMQRDFYQTGENEVYGGQSYSWYGTQNLIFLSNNFFYDTDTQGFWLIENPATIQYRWMTGFRQYIYGARSAYTHADLTLIKGHNLTLGASSYSWQSHPIWESTDRILNVREIELIAQGQGTVTVSVIKLDNTPVTHVFNLANTGFQERFRTNFATTGRYLRLRIQADSGDANVDAPTVFAVTLHPEPRTRISTDA